MERNEMIKLLEEFEILDNYNFQLAMPRIIPGMELPKKINILLIRKD